VEEISGGVAPYAQAIRRHYFSLVILNFAETPVTDQAITRVLRATPGYRVIGIVPYGGPVSGDYTVWAYRPPSSARRPPGSIPWWPGSARKSPDGILWPPDSVRRPPGSHGAA
jgi:hypothetical protein